MTSYYASTCWMDADLVDRVAEVLVTHHTLITPQPGRLILLTAAATAVSLHLPRSAGACSHAADNKEILPSVQGT